MSTGTTTQSVHWRNVAESFLEFVTDYDSAVERADELAKEREQFRKERDELQAGVNLLENDERLEAWHEIAGHPFFRDAYDSDDTLLNAMLDKLNATVGRDTARTPRVITAEELREGQAVWACWSNIHGDHADRGRVLHIDRDKELVTIRGAAGLHGFDTTLFVLLKDAPEPEPEIMPAWEREMLQAEAESEKPMPAVGDVIETVEQLDNLPTGTVLLDRQGDSVQRFEDGWRYSNPAAFGGKAIEALQLVHDCHTAPLTVLHVGGDDA